LAKLDLTPVVFLVVLVIGVLGFQWFTVNPQGRQLLQNIMAKFKVSTSTTSTPPSTGITPAPAPTPTPAPAGRTTPNCNAEENTCLCPGSTAWFQMGADRDCDDCVNECEARARGENIGPEDNNDNDNDNNNNNDDDDNSVSEVTKRAKARQKITSASKKKAVAQKKKQCSSFSDVTKQACEASLARINQKRAFRVHVFKVLNPN
jgi:hypothetical protein